MNRRGFFGKLFGFGAAAFMSQYMKMAPIAYIPLKRVFKSEPICFMDMRMSYNKRVIDGSIDNTSLVNMVDIWENRDRKDYISKP